MADFPTFDSIASNPGGSVQVSSALDEAAVQRQPRHAGAPANVAKPKVSVIIVTFCSSNELQDCVEGLLRQSVPIEIFLVDNASPDNTPEMVTDYAARFKNVHAILNKQNVGLAAGNNTPIEVCRGEYLLMLNPDTIFRGDGLERMVKFLDQNPDVGVVGPKNVYQNGQPHMSFARNWGLRQLITWRVLPYRVPRSLYDRFSSYKTRDVLYVSGSCLLIRRNIFQQIGGYDPEYFLTIDDVCDLCMRVQQAGSRTVFLGDAEVVHLTSRSCVQAPYIVVWHGNRCSVYHFLKHKGVVSALAATFLLLIAAAARVVIAGVLSIGSARYRVVVRNWARVCWQLVVHNPIWSGSSVQGEAGCTGQGSRDRTVPKSRPLV